MLLLYFLERHAINILCRRAWSIAHSGGYMSKPHLDSWVKYTGQRNLWDPEKLTCRMKRSLLPFSTSAPASAFFTSHWVPTLCGDAIEPDITQREDWMPLNHATLLWKHGVCNQIDRSSSQNPSYEVDKVRRQYGIVAPVITPYPEKCPSPQDGACLSAPGCNTDFLAG